MVSAPPGVAGWLESSRGPLLAARAFMLGWDLCGAWSPCTWPLCGLSCLPARGHFLAGGPESTSRAGSPPAHGPYQRRESRRPMMDKVAPAAWPDHKAGGASSQQAEPPSELLPTGPLLSLHSCGRRALPQAQPPPRVPRGSLPHPAPPLLSPRVGLLPPLPLSI